jgi:SAM-dependent methyltransferase
MYQNPFANLSPQKIYDGMMSGRFGPRWPDEKAQAGFIARSGPQIVNRTQDYLDLLAKDGAFAGDWRGLDYGCGFGRFAALMLQYGGPEHVEMADPMPHVGQMVKDLGYKNRFHLLPQILTDETNLGEKFDFVFSYSVFTHFNREPFEANLRQLLSRLRRGGSAYITVSEGDFVEHFSNYRYKDDAVNVRRQLEQDLADTGFAYNGFHPTPERREFWGRCFVTPAYLRGLLPEGGALRFIGAPDYSQKLYALTV